MAKLFDKLMNRVIKGKLTIESGDDVGGLDLSEVDLRPKTIQQTEPNWEFDMPINETYLSSNNLSVVSKYYKLCVYNNVLYIVCAISLKNDGESSFTISWDDVIVNHDIEIPSSIGEKIYDIQGKKLTEDNVAQICRFPSYHGSSGASSTIGHARANKMMVRGAGTSSVSAGSVGNFDFRSFLILR